jgi:riboflavin synthase
MFTGLVEALGTVAAIVPDPAGNGRLLTIIEATLGPTLAIGESVAVNGACLTVIERTADTFRFAAGPETLARTNLGELQAGDRVNLERALRASDRLGGHLVQGHVDGRGQVAQRLKEGDWETLWFACPRELAQQMVPKGSITVDGVSLTLVDVEAERFSVALIPHTLEHTTLGFRPVGASVNLETDLLAKYVFKALAAMYGPGMQRPPGVSS